MDLEKVAKLLSHYKIDTLEELEYYLNRDNAVDECSDDPEEKKKNCINAKCYENIFVPDCRKIIEIYTKYFKDEIRSKKLFIAYLVEHTRKSRSSIENYLSCKSCNQQIMKSITNSLKITDTVFKRDFCLNLDKKFNYVTLFETDYTSIEQFLMKQHETTKENFKPNFIQEDKTMTKEEEERLFALTHVSKQSLKTNLSNEDNLKGSNSYKMNLALASFDRNLIEESSKLVDILLKEQEFCSNQALMQLKAKILSTQKRDKEAIVLLEKLVALEKPNINTETNNLLAASIKRDAFDTFALYSDEKKLVERLTLAKEMYASVNKLNNDYYPALNYMYLESMLAYMKNDDKGKITEMRVEFETMRNGLNHKVNDWWSYVSSMEYLVLQGRYDKVLFELKKYFNTVEKFEINDFNLISTIRQLELFSRFCADRELLQIIDFLKDQLARS